MIAKPIPVDLARAAVPRIMNKTLVQNGCWLWQGSVSPRGHARVSFNGSVYYAHRVLWVAFYGFELDPAIELDHVECQTPPCVLFDHLEPVTQLENMARGNGKSAHALRTGECIHGHSLTDPANVYLWRNMRLCRACRKINRRKAR